MNWEHILDKDWYPSKFVYHYTKPDIALEKILVNRTLRLGPFAEVNDPWESKNWCFSIKAGPDDPTGQLTSEVVNWFNHVAKRHAKVLCMTKDREPERLGPDGSLPKSPRDSDFHRGYARPRMWAQYAECHKGVCLAFERDKLKALIEEAAGNSKAYSGAVNYKDYVGQGDAFEIDYEDVERLGKEETVWRHMRDFRGAFFFHKSRDWRDEAEYRCVVLGHNDEPLLVHFGDALAAVIVGERFQLSQQETLMRLWHGPLFRMVWMNGSPHLAPRN